MWSIINKYAAAIVWSVTMALLLLGCGGGGGTSGNSEIQNKPPTYTVSGKVIGAGASGVAVSLAAAATPGTVASTTVTGSEGNYSFADIPDGAYVVKSADSKYGFDPVSVTVSGTAKVVADAQIYALFTISGKVTLDGSGFAGAVVTLSKTSYTIFPIDAFFGTRNSVGTESVSLNPNGAVTQTTATDGSYAFQAVRSGNYTLTPLRSGYVFKAVAMPTMNNIGVVTITDTGTVYVYYPDGITGVHNSVIGDIIYNVYNVEPFIINDHKLIGQDFFASLPGSGQNN